MKTIHQHIDTDLQTLTGSTVPWASGDTATKNSSPGSSRQPAGYESYQNLANKFQQLKTWIKRIIIDSLEGQAQYIDGMIREGSPLYPYNFTGSPQALVLLTNNSRSTQPFQALSLPASGVKVIQLDEHRYEVKFNRKMDDALINIYDAAGELLFTEQIYQKGTFNLVYNLQWTGISQVSFEVISEKRFYRSEIV